MLTRFLDAKFPKNKRVNLGSLVERVRSGTTIRRGTLVLMASGDRRLRLKLLERDTPHKNFSEPLALNAFAAEHKVTANYLLWYLSHDAVAQHLMEHGTGVVLVRVPRQILHEVPVPLPTRVARIKEGTEFSMINTNNSFSKIIEALHNDYLLNVAHGRYRTAAVLAGAVCEVILYQLLVDYGVNKVLLKGDRNLGFRKLLGTIPAYYALSRQQPSP